MKIFVSFVLVELRLRPQAGASKTSTTTIPLVHTAQTSFYNGEVKWRLASSTAGGSKYRPYRRLSASLEGDSG
jgi:hypothetical protein